MKRDRMVSAAVDSKLRAIGRLAGRGPTMIPVLRRREVRGVPSQAVRRARMGVTLTFAFAGFLVGVFTARLPALVDKLTISTVQLGTVLFVWGLGGVVTMQVLRYLMARAGSATVLRIAAPVNAVSLTLVASASTYGLLLAAVALFGVAFGAVEVAAKAQASEVERSYGRPVMGGMHAGWPIGAGVGGLSAALCALLGVSHSWCLGGAAAVALPLTVVLGRTVLTMPQAGAGARGQPKAGVRPRARVRPVVYLFGLIAFAALLAEGAVTDWSGVLLHGSLGNSQAVAALAYPMFQGGMLTGRLGSDRMHAWLGARRLVMVAGLATAGGLLLATAVPQPLVVLAGVYAAGVGISPLLPLTVSLAGASDPRRSDAAIAQLSVIGYGGLLAGPAMIGGLADMMSLRVALAAVAVLLASITITAAKFLPTENPDAANHAYRNNLASPPHSEDKVGFASQNATTGRLTYRLALRRARVSTNDTCPLTATHTGPPMARPASGATHQRLVPCRQQLRLSVVVVDFTGHTRWAHGGSAGHV
jgi:MFS family permease